MRLKVCCASGDTNIMAHVGICDTCTHMQMGLGSSVSAHLMESLVPQWCRVYMSCLCCVAYDVAVSLRAAS